MGWAKNKQITYCKQTAEWINNSQLSYLTTLYCINEAVSLSKAKSKQTAESKQTADPLKKSNCTKQLCNVSVRLYL